MASLLALLALWPLTLPPLCKFVLAGLVVLGTGWHYVRHVDVRSRWFIQGLETDAEGVWRLITLTEVLPARLLAGFVHPALIVLVFALEQGGRRAVALPPDVAPAEALRRLRRHVLVGRFTNELS